MLEWRILVVGDGVLEALLAFATEFLLELAVVALDFSRRR